VDGYATGWLLPAATSPVSITVTWAPQRVVNIALMASAVAAALALVLVWRGRRIDQSLIAASPSADWGIRVPTTAVAASTVAVVTLVSIVIGFALGGALVGIVAGLAAAVALRVRGGRALTAVAPWLTLGLVAVAMAGLQWRRRYRPGVEWPTSFGWAHRIGLIIITLFIVDVLVMAVRRRSVHRRDDPSATLEP
jgi:hypothetical protein